MLRFISFSLATLYLGLASALAFLPISQTKTKLFVLQLLLLAPAVVCYGIYNILQPSQTVNLPENTTLGALRHLRGDAHAAGLDQPTGCQTPGLR